MRLDETAIETGTGIGTENAVIGIEPIMPQAKANNLRLSNSHKRNTNSVPIIVSAKRLRVLPPQDDLIAKFPILRKAHRGLPAPMNRGRRLQPRQWRVDLRVSWDTFRRRRRLLEKPVP